MSAESKQSAPQFYRPVQTVLLTICVFFIAQLLAAILVIAAGSIVNIMTGGGATKLWDEGNPWGQFLFVATAGVLTLRLLWEAMHRKGISFARIGLSRPNLGHVGYALAGFAAYFVSYLISLGFITQIITGLDTQQEQQIGFSKTTTGFELLPIFISLVILPPLVEEIVARGFLFTGLRSKLRFGSATLITSAVFAAAHLGGASKGVLWIAAIDTFILSMVMCYVREKSGSLWPSIGMHFIKNGLAFFILFNVGQYLR